MIDGYNEFCSKIRDGGTLVVNWKIRTGITCPGNVKLITYGSDNGADYRYFDIERGENGYTFSLQTPVKTFRGLRLEYPGLINIENITAAVATAFSSSADVNSLHESVATFKGARRRFDIRVNLPGVVYIDDYAHHPEEIKACVNSLRDYFRGRKITGIFQPHLFSRTRDHAEGFARILDTLDEVILLPVYPAREEPLPGITSRVIFDRMKLGKKYLMEMSDIPGRLDRNTLDVLVTIGAGDIDKLAVPIEKWLGKEEEK
jgi:UDP-N-acetylmuramate--alanine ligase